MDQQIIEAQIKMTEAAMAVMKTSIPRNLDGAWKCVAMQYSADFVTTYHSELQEAFNQGLAAK